MVPRKGWFQK